MRQARRRCRRHLVVFAKAPRLGQVKRRLAADLGARMERPLRELPPGPVAIVGSDIPGIEPKHVAAAFRRLAARDDFVFGPAPDGGFWLVGARRRRPPRGFPGVRWSTAG